MKIYNSLTKQKEIFKPIHPGEVRLYVCGNTVYDDCHIGHARVFVSFDVIIRFFREIGYKVQYVRNITDIDDKIIVRAQKNAETIESLTNRYIQRLREDTASLFVLPPDQEPQATHNIPEILQMIATLVEKGYAYQGANGDVYYRVNRFESYGVLAHRDLASLQEGARVEVDAAKENPLDFVLWKQTKPGEPQWDSPWGSGRPGWHIECSAMSTACLGHHFDLHGGGADLLFPHHENERAQAEAATDETFVNTWMHVGFVQVSGDKMSKSLDNFFTIRDVLKEVDPEVLRYFLVASHYRSQVNYSKEGLEMAKQSLTRLYTALKGLEAANAPIVNSYYQSFIEVMSDDFNAPQAITVLFEIAHAIHKTEPLAEKQALASTLIKCGKILGFFNRSVQDFLQSSVGQGALSAEQIESMIAERLIARQNKNWAVSDQIRDSLMAAGVILEDVGGQTTWRRK